MTRKHGRNFVLGAALLLACAAAFAGHGTWESDDGTHHEVHGAHAMFISEEGAEAFHLADLRDGEVRVFGEAGKQVTVERRGDEATITREPEAGARARSITCRLDTDTCKVLTFDGDSEKVMIVVEKRRECVNGVGDCDVDVEVGDFGGDSAHVIVDKIMDCDGEADCASAVKLHLEALPHHGENVFVHGPSDVQVFGLHDSDTVRLRCPEGDATLRVDKEEAEDTFLCPKHSVPLEPVRLRRIEIIRSGSDQDDD